MDILFIHKVYYLLKVSPRILTFLQGEFPRNIRADNQYSILKFAQVVLSTKYSDSILVPQFYLQYHSPRIPDRSLPFHAPASK